MTDITYQRFVKRWLEVTDLPPQALGPLTPVYKMLTRRLKIMPWPALVVVSILTVSAVFILFGSAVTILASVLQRGF
jgi:hypothetical protein